MNTRVIFVLILVVVASYCEAKKNGGGNKCKAKALCSKVDALEIELNKVSSEGQANNEALQKQIDDLTNELEELKNRPPPTLAPTTEPPFVCSDPWVEFQSSCYLFTNMHGNWADAIAECETHGAKLVSIKSEEENNFVKNRLEGDSWVGLSDDANEDSWVWISDGSALSYQNWNGGEPNGQRSENSVMIYTSGKWNDCSSDHTCYAICEKQ